MDRGRVRARILIVTVTILAMGAIFTAPAFADPAICTAHSIALDRFSPNGDGRLDTARISFTLAQTADVKLAIVNASGAQVRVLVDGDRSGGATYAATFNGRDASGRRLPDGTYRYVLTCRNGSGTQTVSGGVVIDCTPPSGGKTYASPYVFWPNGDGFRDSSAMRFTLSETALVGVRVTTSGGSTLMTSPYVWAGAGGHAYTWTGEDSSGRVRAYGWYRVVLSLRDRAGNKAYKAFGVRISPYADIVSQSTTFRNPVLRLVGRDVLDANDGGWFAGTRDARYRPYDGLRRGDLAVAIVKARGWDDESPGTVEFSDVPESSVLYKYSALAVRHGAMDYTNRTTKTFGSWTKASAAQVMQSIVRGMGLTQLAGNVKAQDRKTPWYAGYSVVGGDLGLRYRYTGTFPGSAYNRRETAYSLDKMVRMESWRIDNMKLQFGSIAARPVYQSYRQRAMTNAARQLIGYPYVWGGESFSEGGFDCSGFLYYVLHGKLGYSIRRTSYEAGFDSRYPRISMRNLMPGDTVYFRTLSTGRIGHTGLYLGNGYFIHSTRSRGGVSIDRFDRRYNSYWVEQFCWGRRLIPVVKLRGVRLAPTRVRRGKGVSLYFRVSKRSRVVARVYRGSTLVRTFANRWLSAGSRRCYFNGRDSAGRIVPAGRYRVILYVRDAELNRTSAARSLAVVR